MARTPDTRCTVTGGCRRVLRVVRLDASTTVTGVGVLLLMADPMKPVMVRLAPAMYEQLKACAEAEDRTVAQTIRRAINHYLREPANG